MSAHDITALAHEWIAPALVAGATAVDATAGAGHDTLFLARAVGPHGRVHAFDIQADAISRARVALEESGFGDRVTWHRACHSTAGDCLDGEPPHAVMFNLGWLPGGSRALTTRPDTTLLALDVLAARLRPGGRLSVVAYRGHAGGAREAGVVAEWFAQPPIAARRPPPQPASVSPRAPVLHMLERIERV